MPTPPTLLTFQQALELTTDEDRSIVIGNDVIFQYGATDNNKYNLSTVY
jgi:hypothetical protein